MTFRNYAARYEEALAANPDLWLSFDTETAYSIRKQDESEIEEGHDDWTITRISFSYEPFTGVSVPWSGEYLPTIIRLLKSAGTKVGWNCWGFDIPVLARHGVEVRGAVIDGQDMWHVFQSDMDKGLEFVTSFYTDLLPWKHKGSSDPVWYSAVDADAALRCVLGMKPELERAGMWDAFYNHSVKLMPILYEAGQRGNLIDLEKQSKLKTMLQGKKIEITAQTQPMVPLELRPRDIYKRMPKGDVASTAGDTFVIYDRDELEQIIERHFEIARVPGEVKFCTACNQPASNKSEHFKGSEGPPHPKTGKPTRVKNPCKEAKGEIEVRPMLVEEFHEVLPFNPGSHEQIKAYIRHFKHPMGRDKKDSSKESADAKHLTDLAKRYGAKHPLYELLLDYAKVAKTLGTYCPTPDANGRIHTTYKNNTSTWRLASANLNMQNWGKREGNPYAKDARKQIIASPGCRLVQIDSASVEAVMLGWFMGDRRYMALASQGIHAWLTAMELKMAFTPENVDIIKSKYKSQYDAFKIANHMCLTGDHEVLTPNGWVRLDAYDWQTPLMEWDTDGSCKWGVPSDHVAAPWEGQLVTMGGLALDTACTPNHHWPVYQKGKWSRPETTDLPASGRIPTVGQFNPDVAAQTDLERIALMVALQADGCILDHGAVQFRFKKARKIDRMRRLLTTRQHTERVDSRGVTAFYIPADSIRDVVGLFDAGKTFRLPWLLNLPVAERNCFLAELPHWDGSHAKGEGTQTNYVTTNRQNAETVQTIAHVTNQQALLRERDGYYRVSFNARTLTRVSSLNQGQVEYSGMVYCPTTSTGYFMVRRNGRVYVTGNTNYGGGPGVLYASAPKVFGSKQNAERVQKRIYELLPTLYQFHHSVRVRAQKEGYLKNPWGHRHYFYDVFTTDHLGNIKWGKDSKRCVAYLPQSSNGCFQRDNILLVADEHTGDGRCLREWMPANLSVHDSMCLDVPLAYVEEVIEILVKVFTRAIPQMANIRIGAEVEAGDNWGDMDTVKKIVIADYDKEEALAA